MIRGWVAIYLILASLAGPRFCPCSRTISLCSFQFAATYAEKGSKPCRCCPTSDSTSQSSGLEPFSQLQDTPSIPCECKCGNGNSFTFPMARVACLLSVLKADPVSIDNHAFHSCIPYQAFPPRMPSVGLVAEMPFHTADDILHIFHRLRC